MEPNYTKHLLEETFLIFKNYPFSSKDINCPVNDTNMLLATDLSAASPGPQLLSHCLYRTDTQFFFVLFLFFKFALIFPGKMKVEFSTICF